MKAVDRMKVRLRLPTEGKFDLPGGVVALYAGGFIGVILRHFSGTLWPTILILTGVAVAHAAVAVLWLGRR